METISTIIPTYNAERFLRETIDSVLAQTHRTQEIIVIDDGSTDTTSDILAEYSGKIRILKQKNAGSASACNLGAKEASGQYLAFIDADDVWLPQKLEVQLNQCSQFKMSYSDSTHFGEGCYIEVVKSKVSPQYSGRILKKLLLGNFITASSVVIDRELFLRHGGFDESYECLQDWALWLKIAAETEIGWVSEPLVKYRIHGQAKSRKVARTLPAHLRVLSEAFEPGGVASQLQAVRNEAYANAYLCVAYEALRAGDGWMATKCSLSSLLKSPTTEACKRAIKGFLMTLRLISKTSV